MLNAQNGARIKVFGGSADPQSISHVLRLAFTLASLAD